MSPDTTVPAQLGNYDIVSKIAEGGMGTVYKARHRATGEIVAVKVIAAGPAKNPVLLQRFEREFMAARVLDHPNVVRAIEYCGIGPYPFLVMEYVDGESLGQWIERAGAMPEADAVRIAVQVCEGLQRAHKQGLVHRDVKPDNILLTREGVAKLTDMGLVKDVEGDLNLTKTGRGLGTPHYMAPEQFRNAKNVDVRGDIYSLGATLYALVTGIVPFENASPLDCWMKKIKNEFPPPKQLNPALSDRVDWAIRRAMSAESARRPASCREFVEDLTGQSRMTPTQAGPIPTPAALAALGDVWYFVYKDANGATQTRKGNTEKIREALQGGHLGDVKAVLVSRTKTGQFQSLQSVPEFRDLVVAPAPLPAPVPPRRKSGTIATGETVRRPPEDEAVDLGANPAGGTKRGSRSGSGAGASDRYGSGSAARSTPTNNNATERTPREVDSKAETEQYVPQEEETPPPRSGRPRRGEKPKKAAFDWTPVMVVVVVILSAAVGYLLMTK